MKVKPMFAWYDFWVGLFWDGKKRTLYFFPVPMFGVRFEFEKPDYNIYCAGGTKADEDELK